MTLKELIKLLSALPDDLGDLQIICAFDADCATTDLHGIRGIERGHVDDDESKLSIVLQGD